MKRYFSKLIVPIAIQIIFTVLYSITVALFPALHKYLFDHVLDQGLSLVFKLLMAYIILIFFNMGFQYLARLYEWTVSKKFNIMIKSDLFSHISSMKNSDFKEKKPSEYLAIFNNNVEAIDEDYISAYIDIIKSVINIVIFATALLIFVDYRITVIVLVLSTATALLPRIMQSQLSFRRKNHLTALSSYFSKVQDLLSGKKRINSLTFQSFIVEHDKSLKQSEETKLSFGRYKTVSDLINALGVFLIEICTFAMVGYLLAKGDITIGTGIAAFGYVTSFLNPIKNILQSINCINSTKETVEETLTYLDQVELIKTNYIADMIDVENMILDGVAYEVENFKLKAFSYKFEKGKKYAIVGHSGSGKSTLMRLMDGTHDILEGKIFINGNEMSSISRDQYIFSVDQFEYLFRTDYLNNVTIYNSMKDDQNLSGRLLEKLNSKTRDKITSFEAVEQLSGGEKQIVSILRMLCANKPIILLDESFSSVDKANASLIKNYIMDLKDKIVIEVTHNVSKENLSIYDGVISFEDGKAELIEI